ncbi:disintegrin and metalloproteinase domain-containing protein 10-like [Rhipicephalus sanguineus]|uniref:disintegrin and metalloproteinase domain-containing protein 10-like n=1 Tax=Rhipicephalus sanguineus TaxID=34632 RepID=UPI0020C246F0|nr:disintegrin and metalloproteinase domain-containing protein 10-like [Rhipicephalus sanguineus]
MHIARGGGYDDVVFQPLRKALVGVFNLGGRDAHLYEEPSARPGAGESDNLRPFLRFCSLFQSIVDTQLQEPLRTSKRALNLRLTPDSSVFHEDLVIESSTEGVVQVDTSNIYSGSVVGEPGSRVFGSLHGGIFEGSIDTGSGDSLYVERSEKFFTNSQPFHSVLYSAHDVEVPASHGGGGPWCGLHGDTEKWMKDVLRRFRRAPREKRRAHKHGRVGRKLQAAAKASNDDKMEDVVQVGAAGYVKRDEIEGRDGHDVGHEYGDDDDDEEGDTTANRRRRRGASASRRVCNLEVTVDHTLFERLYMEGETLSFTRQQLVAAVAFMVKKVNEIYGSTNFGGVEDMHFLVQHIVISEPDDCVGARRKKNPFCSQDIDAPQALFLVSLEPRDDYCLSYRLNYRDFMDGTLGLAWIAGEDVGTGGFCERYRSAIEVDPSGDRYMQNKLSLNTGITTLFNYNHYVGMHVGSLTLAHEIGHSFGSPHDGGRVCVPRGIEGKYLMYESATRGNAPNNDRFSPCSIRNITAILLPVIEGKSNRENCLQKHKGPICGNQIVEGKEECDCGRDESECSDKCCHPRHSKDSTLACLLKKSAACRRVPCSQNATCPQAAAKANMTACNENTQVCIAGECSGSICQKYGLLECFQTGDQLSIEDQCLLTCREPDSQICKLACAFPAMASYCGAKLQPGSPCNGLRGYCDVFHKCRPIIPSGFITSLSGFLFGSEPLAILYEFIANHPFKAAFVILGSSWMTVFAIRCFALHTPSNNPTKKAPLKLKETLRHPVNAIVNN